MNKYLILYGNDGSTFYTMADAFADAVFELAKYTGNTLSPVCEKALESLDKPEEIIGLYNRLVDGYDEIQRIYKIDSFYTNQGGAANDNERP